MKMPGIINFTSKQYMKGRCGHPYIDSIPRKCPIGLEHMYTTWTERAPGER